MAKNGKVIEREEIVIKFAGDSGDGMQFTGDQFSETSAFVGNDLSTFPDYPAEIRAPQGTIGGVSGFQVHIGNTDVNTPGDLADVLVAMNPAALKANINLIKNGATNTTKKPVTWKIRFMTDRLKGITLLKLQLPI